MGETSKSRRSLRECRTLKVVLYRLEQILHPGVCLGFFVTWGGTPPPQSETCKSLYDLQQANPSPWQPGYNPPVKKWKHWGIYMISSGCGNKTTIHQTKSRMPSGVCTGFWMYVSGDPVILCPMDNPDAPPFVPRTLAQHHWLIRCRQWAIQRHWLLWCRLSVAVKPSCQLPGSPGSNFTLF